MPPEAMLNQAPAAPAKRRRGHAQKDERGKFLPTGDYDVGFGRPPAHTRFDGTRPGPGRPKGSRSQDSYMRDELESVREIRIDGVARKLKHRQLISKMMVAKALEKPSERALKNVHDMAVRLFPDEPRAEAPGAAPLGDATLDEMVLRHFFAGLALGEAGEEAGDPLRDLMREPLGPDPADGDEWGEGDWSQPGEEGPEDE